MKGRRITLLGIIALALTLPLIANAANYMVNMDGLQETPPNASPGFGSGTIRLNDTQDTLFFDITWTGLTAPFVAAHFHRGVAGVAGPVIHAITGDVQGGTHAVGFWAGLTARDLLDLKTDSLYVNAHTTTFPSGEIRGQVLCAPNEVEMNGLQEVPPNNSPASGSGTVYFSAGLDSLYFDLSWSGLSSAFVAAHFHRGVAGVAGGVIHAITGDVQGGTHAVGVWAGLTARDVLDFLTDSMYVNAHTTNFPGGEIRGQIHIGTGHVNLGSADIGHPTCVQFCPYQPNWVCVGPVSPGEVPVVSVGLGCNPGSSCSLDCTPATRYAWSGDWMYMNGMYCRILNADGCLCLSLDNILPVEFASVSAMPGNNSVRLDWSTAAEKDLAHFNILRSESGHISEKIGQVNAENRSSGANYSYQDNTARNGISYVYRIGAVDVNGSITNSDAVQATPGANESIVTEYALHQNYPNPFNPETSIAFDLKDAGMVNLTVYNLLGEQVTTLVSANMSAGRHVVTFKAGELPSGVYLYRYEVNGFTAQSKMLLLK